MLCSSSYFWVTGSDIILLSSKLKMNKTSVERYLIWSLTKNENFKKVHLAMGTLGKTK